MKIVSIEEHTIPVSAAMRTASIGFGAMTASVVIVRTDAVRNGRPLVGLALDSIGRYGHGALLRERFIPRLLGCDPDDYAGAHGGVDPSRAWDVLMRDEKPGGHGERAGAVGLLDAALWDILAKWEDRPLWATLHERYGRGPSANIVSVYASGGHYREADDAERLRDDILRAMDGGHECVKIKVGAIALAEDARRVEGALAAVGRGRLAVDGNGTFDAAKMRAYVAAMKDLGLAWFEEPVDPLDYALHREMAEIWPGAIATGENLFSRADVRNLLRYGGLRRDRDMLQVDISLSYGLIEYVRILDMLDDAGWSRRQCVPHAGHLLALNAVAGLGLGSFETAFDPENLYGGFPAGSVLSEGRVTLGDFCGAGFEATPHLMRVFAPYLH